MSTTSASISHLSRRATALAALALALIGSAAFTTAARANFTLNTGKITLTAGSTGASPSVPTGSWVSLPFDGGGGAYFTNPNSSWTGTPDKLYTIIRPGAAGTTGLTLGAAQPSGGIFGSATDTFNGLPWSLVDVGGTGTTPSLTFAGNHTDLTTRQLTAGNLTGLRVSYGGTTYNIGTAFGAGPDRIQSLTGTITGNPTSTTGTITLNWQTDITSADAFGTFRAQFQLVGTYDHP